MHITAEFLIHHRDHIFVFGDNDQRKGRGGAAKFRDFENSYGFITKKEPNNNDSSFYKLDEYRLKYRDEIRKLKQEIESNPDKIFCISAVGSGLANRYGIFEHVILPNLKKDLHKYEGRVVWLF